MSKLKIFIVILIGISIPLYVLWKIVLVDFEYSSFGQAQAGVKVYLKNINGKDLIVLPEEENYAFNKINLKIEQKINRKNDFEIIAYQNSQTSFYPKSEKILTEDEIKKILFNNNLTNIPIGSIFSVGDAVNILLPNNQYRTIFSAELFEKMGYQWENVIPEPIGFTSALIEKDLWRYGDTYPDGTFLNINKNFYLVWKSALYSVEESFILNYSKMIFPINLTNIKPEPFDICRNSFVKNRIECNFDKNTNFNKSNYIFEIKGLDKENIQEIKIKLLTISSWKSFQNNFLVSVANIKSKLIKKYRGYIPFI